jgi:transposase
LSPLSARAGSGIEAGPLSQWLVNALTAADLPVICVETRHMKAWLTAQQINRTDRNDARGIAPHPSHPIMRRPGAELEEKPELRVGSSPEAQNGDGMR